ncbi:MAG TPA: protein-glutamate O-methyltransferase CheR [Bacteroidota bacterium]|nr:protein-glutamate O-methyltransferase CheR [Bacteroidota bacterium]
MSPERETHTPGGAPLVDFRQPIVVPGAAAGPKMTDDLFREIRDFIYRLTGIYFQDSKKYLLEGRLGKRLQILGMADFAQYFQLLRYGNGRAEEMKSFYDAITINETFFFRSEPQCEAFEKTLVPEIVASRRTNGRSRLRVWSAASSSGEEAYSLAMIYLERLKPRFPALELEIVGTDISPTVLETARRGVYREYSVRNTPKPYMDRYFESADGRYAVREDVRRLARFEHVNLFDQRQMRQMMGFDIIFCCNVLIYFDMQSKIQVVSNLYDSLNKGGYLFIGYAESLHGISSAFKLINFPKTVAYKKE